jgi:acetolactate synthase-1/2/3 large subunit
VVAFAGDGSFMMTGQELATAVEQNLPLVMVVCDNAAHGSILQGQRQAFGGDDHAYGTILRSPDFAALARAYGAEAWTVRETADYPAALRAALAATGPALIHLLTDRADIAPFGTGKDAV